MAFFKTQFLVFPQNFLCFVGLELEIYIMDIQYKLCYFDPLLMQPVESTYTWRIACQQSRVEPKYQQNISNIETAVPCPTTKKLSEFLLDPPPSTTGVGIF